MSATDDRVVRMEFNNSTFEKGVGVTLKTLDKLKSALKFSGSQDGLDNVQKSANKFSLKHVNDSIDESKHHFDALRVAALIAFATIVHRAVNAGINVVKAFTIDPIKEGFKSYEEQINATKTILSNTQQAGTNLSDVTKVLANLQHYAQLTVYNFSDMAKNIGTFTANGVALKPAASAIKGIANLAAMSGASSQDASRAMYQLSQAISAGSVKLQDWNSVVNANIGTTSFQRSLAETAVAMGKLPANAVKLSGAMKTVTVNGQAFRNSLTPSPGQIGWLTSDVLTNTLNEFTGSMTKAQLVAKGFTAQQAASIAAMGKTAMQSATQVKTWGQLTQALKEEVAGAYSRIFKALLGNLPQATKLFSALHNALETLLTGPILAFARTLQSWSNLGGRTIAISAFTEAFEDLGRVLKPIRDGFREIFPASSAQNLLALTKGFKSFTDNLKIGAATADNIKRTFAGLFAVIDIGHQIVSGILHVLGSFISALFSGSGGILNLTGNMGDFLVSLDNALKSGTALPNFFERIADGATDLGRALNSVITFISHLFNGFSVPAANTVKTSLSGVHSVMAALASIGHGLIGMFNNLGGKIQPFMHSIANGFASLGHDIAAHMSSASFAPVFNALNAGLLGGIAYFIHKFLKGGINFNFGNGAIDAIKESFEGLTGSLSAMQTKLKASSLESIAIAVGVLTASVVALSLIKSQALQKSLKFLALTFAELIGALAVLNKVGGSSLKLNALALSLNLIATSILLLTGAVFALSRLSWQQLEKGLSAVGALLAMITASTLIMSKNSGGMIRVGIALNAIAIAMNILYLAVLGFSKLSWSELLRGLTGVAGALAAIAIGMRAMPRGMLLQAAALTAISLAINGIALAVSSFAKHSWSDLLKGLVGLGGALVIIAGAMRLMPKGMLLQAASLIAISTALNIMAKALSSMGQMSGGEIAKGLITLAASLGILVVALNAMDGALAGAAALLVVATALRIFAPALAILGNMSWTSIIKGLVALAAGFGVIGVAALALTPVIPEMLALGIALLAIGAAMALAGAGAALFGVAFTALAAAGSAGVAVLLSALKGIIELLPEFGKNLALGLTNFIVIIGKNAPQIIGAFVKLLGGLLDAIPKLMPKLVRAMGSLLQGIFQVIEKNIPGLVKAGISIILALLRGIEKNIGKVVVLVVKIIANFLNAVADHLGEIIQAGVHIIVKLLEGIASGTSKIIKAGADIIIHVLTGIGNAMDRIVTAGGNAIINFLKGVGRKIPQVIRAFTTMIINIINAIGKQGVRLANAGALAILHFVEGLTAAINKYAPELREAGIHLAEAIINGMTFGLAGKIGGVIDTVKHMGSSIIGGIGGVLGIHSPSREFMKVGQYIGDGLRIGIQSKHNDVVKAASTMGENTLNAMRDSLSRMSDSISTGIDASPVIRPIIDLTEVRKGAAQINGLVNKTKVIPTVSVSQASGTAKDVELSSKTTSEKNDAAPVSVSFTQNNTSPESLSTKEIYRRTHNQLSQVRLAAGLPAKTT